MKNHKDFEEQVKFVMSVIKELVNHYEIIDVPQPKFLNTLTQNSFGRKNKDGSKRKESVTMNVSITKPTETEIETIVKSILIKYKFDF